MVTGLITNDIKMDQQREVIDVSTKLKQRSSGAFLRNITPANHPNPLPIGLTGKTFQGQMVENGVLLRSTVTGAAALAS